MSSSAKTPAPQDPIQVAFRNMQEIDDLPSIQHGEPETYNERVTKPDRVAASNARAYPGMASQIQAAQNQDWLIKAIPTFFFPATLDLAVDAISEAATVSADLAAAGADETSALTNAATGSAARANDVAQQLGLVERLKGTDTVSVIRIARPVVDPATGAEVAHDIA